MELSIVAVVPQDAVRLTEFCSRAASAALESSHDFEIVLVSDGCESEAAEAARRIASQTTYIRFIELSRSFGVTRAIMTGLEYASGNLVFLLDCDSDDPALLGNLIRTMRESGSDVVYVVRARGGTRVGDRLIDSVFRYLATPQVPEKQGMMRLMTARYVAAVLAHRDRVPYLPALWQLAGYTQVPLSAPGAADPQEPALPRRLIAAVGALTTFSTRPLIQIFYLGLAILLLATAGVVLLMARTLFLGPMLSGWPSLIVSIWLMGGLIVFALGVVAIYLSRVYMETKDRPYTVVRAVYRNIQKGDQASG